MFNFLRQLLCKHNYEYINKWECLAKYIDDFHSVFTPTPIFFFECAKCGKRKIVKDSDYLYQDSILNLANMWVKGELDVEQLDKDNRL